MEEYEKVGYLSFNAMSRKPQVFGIPMMILVFSGIFIVLSAIAGALFFEDVRALFFPLLGIAWLFIVRLVSVNDSRAMEKLSWRLKGLIYLFKCRSSVASFSSNINKNDKEVKRYVSEYFKNCGN